MTWIKPNFLWMMYRNGWGTKEGQEVTLAIHLKMEAFIKYLQEAEYSTFDTSDENDHELWKNKVLNSSSRLQWDPDHDPHGNKLDRRAIQIGVRNELTKAYATEDILAIEDISHFVDEQRKLVVSNQLDKLRVPLEKPLVFKDEELNRKLKINNGLLG